MITCLCYVCNVMYVLFMFPWQQRNSNDSQQQDKDSHDGCSNFCLPRLHLTSPTATEATQQSVFLYCKHLVLVCAILLYTSLYIMDYSYVISIRTLSVTSLICVKLNGITMSVCDVLARKCCNLTFNTSCCNYALKWHLLPP